VDPAPGFSALTNDKILISSGIHLEVGRPKNPNKNPVAEHAIGELGTELLNLHPEGGPVSKVTFTIDVVYLFPRNLMFCGKSSSDARRPDVAKNSAFTTRSRGGGTVWKLAITLTSYSITVCMLYQSRN
jgi:hypothetical protein